MRKEELFELVKKTADLEVIVSEAKFGINNVDILNQSDDSDDIEPIRTEYLKKCVDIVQNLYEQHLEELKNSKLDIPQEAEYSDSHIVEYLIRSLDKLKDDYWDDGCISDLVYNLGIALEAYQDEDEYDETCCKEFFAVFGEFYDMVAGWFNE